MRTRILIYTIALAGCLAACQKEDHLTPSDSPVLFAPQPGATDEESVLRREFYGKTGCHILFNDTLRHEYQGLDGHGKPFYLTETVGLEWNISSGADYRFTFDYLKTMDQKRKAVRFMENYLLHYLEKIMPYSILVVNNMEQFDVSNGVKSMGNPLTYSSVRCVALNVSKLDETPESEWEAYAQDICCEMIFVTIPEQEYQRFIYVNPYGSMIYGAEKYGDEEWDFSLEDLKGYCGIFEDPYPDRYVTEKEDAVAYIKACLLLTEDEFDEGYEVDYYSKIKQKYNIIKPIVEKSGIQFK